MRMPEAHWSFGLPTSQKSYGELPPDVRLSAVNLLFFGDVRNPQLLFIRRAFHPEDKHSHQIAFPGGGQEPDDVDLQVTAQREMKEELGIHLDTDMYLGQLSDLYIPISNYLVRPFVAYLPDLPTMVLDPAEVDSTLSKDLTALIRQEIQTTNLSHIRPGLNAVPHLTIEGQVLWGASAMILNELLELIRQADTSDS